MSKTDTINEYKWLAAIIKPATAIAWGQLIASISIFAPTVSQAPHWHSNALTFREQPLALLALSLNLASLIPLTMTLCHTYGFTCLNENEKTLNPPSSDTADACWSWFACGAILWFFSFIALIIHVSFWGAISLLTGFALMGIVRVCLGVKATARLGIALWFGRMFRYMVAIRQEP